MGTLIARSERRFQLLFLHHASVAGFVAPSTAQTPAVPATRENPEAGDGSIDNYTKYSFCVQSRRDRIDPSRTLSRQ
ncbi:MAG: hypothetical protein ACTHLY_16470 [Pseudolabrys sp.]